MDRALAQLGTDVASAMPGASAEYVDYAQEHILNVAAEAVLADPPMSPFTWLTGQVQLGV